MPQPLNDNFVAPEQRLTPKMRERLEDLAPLFCIKIKRTVVDGQTYVELSGDGFSEGRPVTMSASEATVRLLAEICSILTRWVPFSLWEPCDVTLFALPSDRIERHAASFRKHLAQQRRREALDAEERKVREVFSAVR